MLPIERRHAVTDLRKGDFELLGDGQQQEIDEFEPVDIPAGSRSPKVTARTPGSCSRRRSISA